MDEEIFLLTATSDIPKILLLPTTFALKRSSHLFFLPGKMTMDQEINSEEMKRKIQHINVSLPQI